MASRRQCDLCDDFADWNAFTANGPSQAIDLGAPAGTYRLCKMSAAAPFPFREFGKPARLGAGRIVTTPTALLSFGKLNAGAAHGFQQLQPAGLVHGNDTSLQQQVRCLT